MRLGLPVVYHVHQGHHEGALGSIHHPELRDFHAHVTRVHDDGTCDLVFFPPNRAPQHADKVPGGAQDDGRDYWTEGDETPPAAAQEAA